MRITKTKTTIVKDYLGVPLTIARSNNTEFLEKFRRIAKPYRRQIENSSLPAEKNRELTCEAMAGTVLVDWDVDALEKVTGERAAFSPESAKALLMDDPDCREFVANVAADLDQFLAEDLEDVTGKS